MYTYIYIYIYIWINHVHIYIYIYIYIQLVWWVLHDVIKWKHFSRYWPLVRGIHRSPVNSPHKGQWRGALMSSSICTWTNGWVNNRYAGDLRRHRAHFDVTVMLISRWPFWKTSSGPIVGHSKSLVVRTHGKMFNQQYICRHNDIQVRVLI